MTAEQKGVTQYAALKCTVFKCAQFKYLFMTTWHSVRGYISRGISHEQKEYVVSIQDNNTTIAGI